MSVGHNLETPGELIDRMDGTLQARTKAWKAVHPNVAED